MALHWAYSATPIFFCGLHCFTEHKTSFFTTDLFMSLKTPKDFTFSRSSNIIEHECFLFSHARIGRTKHSKQKNLIFKELFFVSFLCVTCFWAYTMQRLRKVTQRHLACVCLRRAHFSQISWKLAKSHKNQANIFAKNFKPQGLSLLIIKHEQSCLYCNSRQFLRNVPFRQFSTLLRRSAFIMG